MDRPTLDNSAPTTVAFYEAIKFLVQQGANLHGPNWMEARNEFLKQTRRNYGSAFDVKRAEHMLDELEGLLTPDAIGDD